MLFYKVSHVLLYAMALYRYWHSIVIGILITINLMMRV